MDTSYGGRFAMFDRPTEQMKFGEVPDPDHGVTTIVLTGGIPVFR
jgi:hypothetical protein